MSSKGKGKEIFGKGSSGKRKRDEGKFGGRKRINREVLQFFEDAAGEASDYDTSDFEDDFPEDDDIEPQEQGEPGKSGQLPLFPKEEELSGDELERVLEERYRSGSGYVRYAEDDYETKRVNRDFVVPSAPDPNIWKVKCKVGRERQTIFCLMQKYVDLKSLGAKLQIFSAFSVEHIKGFIFVEANKQFEVMEACKHLPDVYYSLVSSVPNSEFTQLLAVRRKQTEVTKGMWVRVKNGNYKGDLAQVVAVSELRRKATVKLIPRVDFQALALKFGGGSSIKRTVIPKPRLITSSELEEFRPLMQYKHDRDTGLHFEVLDGLMLKHGYLYKKVSIDSLRLSDVHPSVEELQKFRTSNNDDSSNLEFLSQLYGEKKEKSTLKHVQGGGKGEGSSGSKEQENFQVHDLVLFGKREFGMVIGMEKDDNYKILKNGSEGSTVVSLGKKDLKNLHLDKKFTALDHCMKTIFVNDVVRNWDGPLKDREGVVKQIYRGIIFLYDQNDMEDNAYFCAKSQFCEKVKQKDNIFLGKNGEAGPSGCEDLPSSPKSPLSPEKPWQIGDQNRDFNRREKEGMLSVGQSLRIRVGPLKGYLCRVLAVRHSDVTVKLDSRQKVLKVKSEHLSEVRGKSFATSTCDDTGLDSSRPFDFLGNQDGVNDWMAGSVESDDRDAGGLSNERSSWPTLPSSASSLPWGVNSENMSSTTEDAAWQKKPGTTLEGGSSWGQPVLKVDNPSAPENEAGASWDKSMSSHDNQDCEKKLEDPWDKGKKVVGGTGSWVSLSAEKDQQDSWNKGHDANLSGSWDEKGSHVSLKQWASKPSGSAGWGQQNSWEKSKAINQGNSSWGGSVESQDKNTFQGSENAWNQAKNSQDKGTGNPVQGSWGKAEDTWGNNSSQDKNTQQGSENAWDQAKKSQDKGTGNPVQGSRGKAEDTWGSISSQDKNTQQGSENAWDQAKISQDKGTGNPVQGSWGKAVETWGNKSSSDRTKEWKNPAPSTNSQSCGWGAGRASWIQPEGQNATGGWGKKSNDERAAEDGSQFGRDSWGKPKSLSGGASWSKSDLKQEHGSNEGWTGGRGSVGRSSGTAAWDGGKSGPSSWSQQKSCGKVNNESSWDKPLETNLNTGEASHGKWGNSKAGDTSDRQPDNWKKPNLSAAEGAPSWGKSAGNGMWRQSSRSDDDQGFSGGHGFGGRRGRGNYGGRYDQSGRGRGSSFGRGQFSSWNKDGHDGASWGNTSDTSTGNGDSWRKDKGWSGAKGSWGGSSYGNWNQGGGSGEDKSNNQGGWKNSTGWSNDQDSNLGKDSNNEDGSDWEKQKTSSNIDNASENKGWNVGKGASDHDNSSGWKQGTSASVGSNRNAWAPSIERSSEPAAGWNNVPSGCGQQKSWEKDKSTADGNSTWGKAMEESQVKDAVGWGNAVDSWAKKNASSGNKEWKSSSDAPGKQGGGWGEPSGKWGTCQEENVPSWNTWSQNDTWGQSKSFGNNQGRGRGRGGDFGNNEGRGRGRGGDYGGRRERGGYRGGGRDQSGRGGRGRSFGERQNWNNEGQDKPSWGSSSSSGRNDEGSNWGNKGGSGWGNSSSGAEANNGGSSRGKKCGSTGGGGWGGSSGGNTGAGGWGSSSGEGGGRGWGVSSGEGRSWGKDKGSGGWGGSSGGNTSAGGWGSSSAGKSSQGAGDSSGSGGGWGGSTAGKSDEGGGSGWGKSSGGGTSGAGSIAGGGWGATSGGVGKSDLDGGGWGGKDNKDGSGNSGGGWGKGGSGGW